MSAMIAETFFDVPGLAKLSKLAFLAAGSYPGHGDSGLGDPEIWQRIHAAADEKFKNRRVEKLVYALRWARKCSKLPDDDGEAGQKLAALILKSSPKDVFSAMEVEAERNTNLHQAEVAFAYGELYDRTGKIPYAVEIRDQIEKSHPLSSAEDLLRTIKDICKRLELPFHTKRTGRPKKSGKK